MKPYFPVKDGQTWIDPEEVQTDYGQFRRNALVYHKVTGELIKCRADIPDTFFSIPATTKTECGYISAREDGEFEFRPYTEQTQTPVEYRKTVKRAYK
jgi:hypothetical protein